MLWTDPTTVNPLGRLNVSRPTSQAYAINNSGDIAGNAVRGGVSWENVATFWDTPPAPTDLGTPSTSTGWAISDTGHVAGWYYPATGDIEAFVWTSGAGLSTLGRLSGAVDQYAFGINDSGIAVGRSDLAGGSAAALWSSAGSPVDLNAMIDPTSGWELQAAMDINNDGQIVGNGQLNGDWRAFLLTPIIIPEPGTGLLAALVGGLLLACSRRRQAAPQ